MDTLQLASYQTIELAKNRHLIKSHEAVVCTSTLMKLGILNNTWIDVSISESMKEHQEPNASQQCAVSFPLKCVSCETTLQNDLKSSITGNRVAYVSGVTAFNILSSDLNSYRYFQEGGTVEVSVRKVRSSLFEPPIADKVTISVVRSPVLSELENEYDEFLKEYFEERQHLVVNQLFCINISKDFREQMGQGQERYLWFKVLKIHVKDNTVNSAWIENGVSTLIAMDSVNNPVPYYHKTEDDSLSPNIYAGLDHYFSEITSLIRPVVENHIDPVDIPILLYGQSAVGKRSLAMKLSNHLFMHCYEVNCFCVLGESIAAMEQRVEAIFKKAEYFSPCLLLLRNIHALCKDRDGDADEPRLVNCVSKCLKELDSSSIVVTIATTTGYDQLSPGITRLFTHTIEVEAPDEARRLDTLNGLMKNVDISLCSIDVIGKKTAGMVLGDFCTLASEAVSNAARRKQGESLERSATTQILKESSESLAKLLQSDFDAALDKIHADYKDTLGMPKIPEVSWNDVGGLADVKAEIIDTIKLPLQYPELVSKGLRRSGILLYGPPGCGKTLLAKAVATEFSLNFFSVKGPELINMYVGQSEQNVRDMFQKARESSPCIIFFDELDSIAPNRGKSGDSGGVMDRVVSQLLSELDGLQSSNELFVIGATNRPDLLDGSLLRPGRFDKMVYVGFPETRDDRMNIMKSYTDKMQLDIDVDLYNIEETLPLYLTGADFYAVCSDAYLSGIKRCIQLAENGNEEIKEGVMISRDDFHFAIQELVPSVSTNDVLKYKEMKRKLDNDRFKKPKTRPNSSKTNLSVYLH